MKNRKLKAAFRCMEQPTPEIFRPLAEQQQQMALDGSISSDPANGTDDDLAPKILTTPRLTLAELFLAAAKAESEAKTFGIAIEPGVRRAVVVLPATGGSVTTGTQLASLTKDDPTKKSSSALSNSIGDVDNDAHPGIGALQDVLTALIAARKPSISAQAIITAVDNFMDNATVEQLADLGKVVVDVRQMGDGTVNVFAAVTVENVTGREVEFVQDQTPLPSQVVVPFDS